MSESKRSPIRSFQHFLQTTNPSIGNSFGSDFLYDLFGRYGFNMIGSGLYSTVYSHPKKDYVVKVFTGDAGYLEWVNYSMKHPDNPYCPKFRGKVMSLGGDVYTIRVEKLSDTVTVRDAMDLEERLLSDKRGDNHDDPFLAPVTKFIRSITRGTRDSSYAVLADLHAGNFMHRGRQIVIVDPFAMRGLAYIRQKIDPQRFRYAFGL